MALVDSPIVRRLAEQVESRLGVTVMPAQERERLTVMEQEFGELQNEASELALHSLDYFNGRPQEMRPERRRRLAQRSRIALMQDPLAGAEAGLLADFGFGKGINVPAASDPKVQDIIDGAWSDPINQQLALSYQAQRKLSNELITSGELFFTLYVSGGRIRLGRLDPDLVVNIVTDPENRNIPLWYVARDRTYEWDFATDQPKFVDTVAAQGGAKVKYWPHWRNAKDAIDDRDSFGTEDGENELEQPPTDKLAKGLVYHVAINQTGEQLRGNPPWARSLRFMSAMNVLTEAHVTMAQAASTFIARRAMKGSPRQITKAAASVLSQAGELGASAFRPETWGGRVSGNAEPTTQPFTAPDTPAPFPPGSWWNESQDSSTLSPLNLQSGSGQMAQTAQIVRAPIAASSGFGQHYLGDAQNANLATASTLELPATMRIGGWQQNFEDFYRWFTDRAIEAAVQAGRLGGIVPSDGDRPLSEMRLHESDDIAAMEARTGKKLSYKFTMPFPGRRQLADVTTFVTEIASSMDPNGVSIALRKILLQFAFEQVGIDDVAGAVEECIPATPIAGGIGPQAGPGFAAASAAASTRNATAGGAVPGGSPAEGQQPYGAKSGTAAGGGSAGADGTLEGWVPEPLRKAVTELQDETAARFRELVTDPSIAALMGVNGSH